MDMDWFLILQLLMSAIFLLVILWRRYRAMKSEKLSRRRPLGLTQWPIVGVIPAIVSNIHRLFEGVTGLLALSHLNYQCRFWFAGFRYFLTCDPANVRHIFTSNFENYPKGVVFGQMFDILGGGIFNSDGERWRRQRTKAQMLMTTPRYRAFVERSSLEKVEKCVLPFLAHVAENTASATCDLQDVFMRWSFDTTSNLVYGVDPGCLAIGLPEVPFARAMDDALRTVFLRHIMPVTLWRVMRRLDVGHERKNAAAQRTADSFVAATIASRRAAHKKQGADNSAADLLSSFLYDEEVAQDPDADQYIREMTLNLLVAGRDATSSALSWFFYLMATHPRVEQKLLQELAPIAARKKEKGMVAFEAAELKNLLYLHAAVCECLRLYPSLPMESKTVAAHDVLPSGHEVWPGDKILVFNYSMGRMKRVWGADCREFRPERWISEDGKLRYVPSNKFVAFNSGPRTCLGKEMVLVQMKVTVAAVLWNFAVEVVPGHVVEPKLSIILHMKNGLLVRVKRRSP
ncbi:unnamed protein product [Alopecurus aequalis]